MNTNVFNALDMKEKNEKEQKTENHEKTHLTKKESREEEKNARAHFGDQVAKDTHQKIKDSPKKKDDYESGEPRPFDRHSGTGKPAFLHQPKKGGHGKGNVGGETELKDELLEMEVEEIEKKEEHKKKEKEAQKLPAKNQKESIITLDEYVAKTGFNTDFLNKQEQVHLGKLNHLDPNIEVVIPKKKSTAVYNKKNVKHNEEFLHGGANLAHEEAQEAVPAEEKNVKKQSQKVEFNDQNFPKLD